MTCYHPYTVMYPAVENADGKRYLDFAFSYENYEAHKEGKYLSDDNKTVYRNKYTGEIEGHLIKIPCGRCIGCRLDYSRQWAVRALHESMLHKDNTFVTLTFDKLRLSGR